MNKVNLIAIVFTLLLTLCSCQKDEKDAGIKETNKAPWIEIDFSAKIDNEYKYDEENLRTAGFQAQRLNGRLLPTLRISTDHLKQAVNIVDGHSVKHSSFGGTHSTQIHLKFGRFRNGRMDEEDALELRHGFSNSFFRNHPIVAKIENNRLYIKAYSNDVSKFFRDDTWAMWLCVGGIKGEGTQYTPQAGLTGERPSHRMHQWFSYRVPQVRTKPTFDEAHNSGRGTAVFYNTAPNEVLQEVRESGIVYRHFPLMTDWRAIKYYDASKETPRPGYGNNEVDRSGAYAGSLSLGRDEWHLKLRGSVFSFTIENQTGEEIEIESIETPYDKGFKFNGYYDGINSGINQNPNFVEFKAFRAVSGANYGPYRRSETISRSNEYAEFAIRASGSNSDKIRLAQGEITEGVFFLWADATEATTPLQLRIKYNVNQGGSTVIKRSLMQKVSLPSTGRFEEGKAYYTTFRVKPS